MSAIRKEEVYEKRYRALEAERLALQKISQDRSKEELSVKREKPNNNYKIVVLLFTMLPISLAIIILTRYANITSINNEIAGLEAQYLEMEKDKVNLSAELERLKTSINIMEDAAIKLGMVMPEESQIMYVDINNKVEESKEAGLIDKLAAFFRDLD